jgi:kynurenine formamidase
VLGPDDGQGSRCKGEFLLRPLNWKTFAVAYALALAVLLFAQRRTPAQREAMLFSNVIDLTYAINDKAPVFDKGEKFHAQVLHSYEKDGYFTRQISLPEHFATHLDAPAHFARGAWTVEQIPAERLVRPLVVLDVSTKARSNADYQVTVEDIARWEEAHGELPTGAVVAAFTGWGARWGAAADYRNADAKGVLHFPGYSLEAAKFLVEARNVVGLGIDTLSVDYGASKEFAVHKYSASRSVFHLENLAQLERAPQAGATVVIAPAKLEGGSGAPARVMVLIK